MNSYKVSHHVKFDLGLFKCPGISALFLLAQMVQILEIPSRFVFSIGGTVCLCVVSSWVFIVLRLLFVVSKCQHSPTVGLF